MEREEQNEQNNKELEESVYSSLNIGSFLELKRRERDLEKKKETSNEPKKEVVKVTPLVKEEPKKEVVTKKVVAAIEEKKVIPKKETIEKPKKEETKKIEQPKKEIPKSSVKETAEKKQDIHELLRKRKEAEKNAQLQKEEKSKKEIKEDKEEIKKEKKSEELPKEEKQSEEKKKVEDKKEEIKTETIKEKEKKKKGKKEKKEKKIKDKTKLGKGLVIGLVVCIIMDLFAFTGLFLTYGPISYFRNLLVTSAMTTMSHKYLARTFYSDKTIEKILSQNTLKEVDENTNSSDIDFAAGKDTGEYSSIYEEQILKREKDQLYKVIDINEGNARGYLVAIYDASRVKLVGASNTTNYGGAFLTNIAKREGAKVAINASGFYDGGNKGSTAVGTVIMDGKVILTGGASGYGGGLSGFNKDHVLVLTREDPETAIKNGMVDAVEFGPFLIVNGKAAEIKGDGGWGIASRTVLAQRKDGIVLFLVIDGRQVGYSLGIDMNGLIKILQKYGAYNAVNLDGGGSTTLVVDGKLANKPCCSVDPTSKQRYVPNAWVVK